MADLSQTYAEMHEIVAEQVLEDLKSGDRKARQEAMQLLKQNNVTATASELNIMDGVTRTASQINSARDGTVTSVATGTGLTGGTITSTGTISINTTAGGVGTYAFLARNSTPLDPSELFL